MNRAKFVFTVNLIAVTVAWEMAIFYAVAILRDFWGLKKEKKFKLDKIKSKKLLYS